MPTSGADWSLAERAYDAIAGRYDRVPAENRVNRIMREHSLNSLRAAFARGSRVLELGCGSGEEALDLAGRGVRVVAVDASGAMVREAIAKAEARGLAGVATFLQASSRELALRRTELGAPFDGAFASFSLAYEPDLKPVVEGLHRLLRPGASFLASFPSRVCAVELFLALATGRPGLAGRRLRPWYGHTVGRYSVPIRSYAPAEVRRAFAPSFDLIRWEAVIGLVPPPYMNRVYGRLDGLADAIERVDVALRLTRPMRSVGDHFLAEFRNAG